MRRRALSRLMRFIFFTSRRGHSRCSRDWSSDVCSSDLESPSPAFCRGPQQVAEKRFGMLREPQHERKILNDIKTPPFVLSTVEGLRQSFSTTYSTFIVIFMLKSTTGAECVSAPEEMKSTPVSATCRIFSEVIPPEASTQARLLIKRTASAIRAR